MNIAPEDRVLEIGSGHNPDPRSNVLIEKFIDDTVERGDALKRDNRVLINAEGEKLPFKEKSFDYVICRHVLEHSSSPGLFLEEIQRVGRRGYIDSPSPIWELIYTPRKYHRCLLYWDQNENRLLVKSRREDEYSQFGKLFAYLYENDILFRLFHQNNQELLYTRFEWEDRIDFRVLKPEEQILPDLYDTQKIEQLFGPRLSFGSKKGRRAYKSITKLCQKLGL